MLATILGYWEPINKKGYCAVQTTKSTLSKHENCRCNNVNDTFICASKCKQDVECQGYSYDQNSLRCMIYSTADCSAECYKKHKGRTGKIVAFSSAGSQELGCFIKKRSNCLYLDLIENIL